MPIKVRSSVFAILVISLISCNRNYRARLSTGFEGKSLPNFEILLSDSATRFKMADIPNGNPVVLLFFSPTCPYSQAEIVNIVNNMSTLSRIRFYIITNWPFDQFKAFYTHYQLGKYSNIIAGQDYKNVFQGTFSPIGVPYTVIYNGSKNMIGAFVGTMPCEQIKDVVEKN